MVFHESFARKQIRSHSASYFQDHTTGQYESWQKGMDMRLKDVQALKLYTDFDSLQKALKYCLRFEVGRLCANNSYKVDSERKEMLEFNLTDFYHWKGLLMIVLSKFSRPLERGQKLYHGVDTKMIIAANKTLSFYGPISTTSSEHIAKTFATAKGIMISCSYC